MALSLNVPLSGAFLHATWEEAYSNDLDPAVDVILYFGVTEVTRWRVTEEENYHLVHGPTHYQAHQLEEFVADKLRQLFHADPD